jgi:hypothetical protein
MIMPVLLLQGEDCDQWIWVLVQKNAPSLKRNKQTLSCLTRNINGSLKSVLLQKKLTALCQSVSKKNLLGVHDP